MQRFLAKRQFKKNEIISILSFIKIITIVTNLDSLEYSQLKFTILIIFRCIGNFIVNILFEMLHRSLVY